MVSYAALRFAEDKNISDRVYWYRSTLSLSVGERVLAPVGMRNRLQRATVERLSPTPPFAEALLKEVAAKDGARRLRAGGEVFRELGGVRYDDRHYTRFCRFLVGEGGEGALPVLDEYGVTARCGGALGALFASLPAAHGCVLLTGAHGGAAGTLLLLAAGVPTKGLPPDMVCPEALTLWQEGGMARLSQITGLAQSTLARIAERLH